MKLPFPRKKEASGSTRSSQLPINIYIHISGNACDVLTFIIGGILASIVIDVILPALFGV